MDYAFMTAPCGLDCFNCIYFLAHEDDAAMEEVKKISEQYGTPIDVMLCMGCRAHDGRIPLHQHLFGEDHRCASYECVKGKELEFCGDCDDFPCDFLHPYADMSTELPHNFKVFNLCLIKRMGVDKWAETKSAQVRHDYFNLPWTLAKRDKK
ncbi:conserved hypothetical protein [Desulfatibacillum aliphaticivorans]|uniref:DUF3795 domain-containing protein n=1 Tax=Desulfatibacillum aliphaticivorans TaxID=218208 RepID=B8FCT6_DESAL|nr:DUF3795 domain-containing protein [Desulfatibacillum aliphaticivorans]ACL06367.1 conserved hypothetical protein [Desulfatibacillum aliphaticivorans]